MDQFTISTAIFKTSRGCVAGRKKGKTEQERKKSVCESNYFLLFIPSPAESASSAESWEPLTSHCMTSDLPLSTSHRLQSAVESRLAWSVASVLNFNQQLEGRQDSSVNQCLRDMSSSTSLSPYNNPARHAEQCASQTAKKSQV